MFVSVGNSRMEKKFNGQEMTYEEFAKRLSQTTYTAETMEQYRKMPKGEQDNVKDVGGFVLGKLKGGRRKKDSFPGLPSRWIWIMGRKASLMRLRCFLT